MSEYRVTAMVTSRREYCVEADSPEEARRKVAEGEDYWIDDEEQIDEEVMTVVKTVDLVCPHSACRQNYIDTGKTGCIQGKEGE